MRRTAPQLLPIASECLDTQARPLEITRRSRLRFDKPARWIHKDGPLQGLINSGGNSPVPFRRLLIRVK